MFSRIDLKFGKIFVLQVTKKVFYSTIMKRRILFSLILELSYLTLIFNSSEARQHNNENDNVKFQNLKEKVEVCKIVIDFEKKDNQKILIS